MPEATSFAPSTSELERFWGGGDARAVLETVMDFVPGVVVIVAAPSNQVLYVSDFAGRLLGRPRQEMERFTYESFADAFPSFALDGRRLTVEERPIGRSLQGEAVQDFETYMHAAGGGRVLLRCSSAPIRNAEGKVIGAIGACSDIRRDKAREAELVQAAEFNRALHDELAHRVKNHLQVISGLIATESRGAPTPTVDFARKIMGVMQGLATVYDSIVHAGGTAEAEVDAYGFLDAVCRAYRTEDLRVEVATDAGLKLDSVRAATVGAVVNEAVCNAYKYAYPDGRGCIEVRFARDPPGRLRLEVLDRGVGPAATSDHAPGSGMRIMELLARQMDGALTVEDRAGGGTAVCLTLPETPPGSP